MTMKLRLTWKAFAILEAMVCLILLLIVFFPITTLPNRASPLVELSELQQLSSDASQAGHPLSANDVKDAIKKLDRPFEAIGYDARVVGTGPHWIVLVTRQRQPSRLNSLLNRPEELDIVSCMLTAQDPHVILVDATGRTTALDLSTLRFTHSSD